MADNQKQLWRWNVAIGVMAALLFVPFLGGVHLFDWDEINFAESAREMLVSKDYLTVQINFIPFWEKPPLFIWMQALSMKIFGINEFAARFPNAICGIVSLLVLFNTGRKLVDQEFGKIWVLLYAGSMLPFFYFKSGIIDPWFNLFIFVGIYWFYRYCSHESPKMLFSAASALFIGLAILTKGPVAFLIFALTAGIFILVKRFKIKIRFSDVLVFIIVLIVTGGLWFILQILKGNFNIIADFIAYQVRLFRTRDAGHGGFLFYHFVVLFAGVFPASIPALFSIFGTKSGTGNGREFFRWMLILFWVVLLLFTVVRTKIVHYSSLCYFPLTYLAAWTLYYHKNSSRVREKITLFLSAGLGILLALVTIGITFIDSYKGFIISHGWLNDKFAEACLMADGAWKGYEFTAGLVLLVGVIAYLLTWKKDRTKSFLLLTCSIPVFMFLAMLLIVPRVEAYSQRSAIEFFHSVSHEDAYLETIGYKSYAHLFYGKVPDHNTPESKDEKWLLTGAIDKNAYFSIKITAREKFMKDYPELRFLYEKNGFAFFKRTPKKHL